MLSAYALCRPSFRQRCSPAVGQVIGGCRMALPHVAVVQIGGVDTKLARFAYAIYVVECGVVRAVEIIKRLSIPGADGMEIVEILLVRE